MSFKTMLCCPACQAMTFECVSGVIQQCSGCGLGIQPVLPDCPSKLYQREVYDRHRQEKSHQPGTWARFWHDYAVGTMRVEQLAKHLPKNGLWVDFGCGNSGVLAAARDSGFDTLGVELDSSYCQEILVNTGTVC